MDLDQCLPLTFLIELGVCPPPQTERPSPLPSMFHRFSFSAASVVEQRDGTDKVGAETTKKRETQDQTLQQKEQIDVQYLCKNVYCERYRMGILLSTINLFQRGYP